MPQRKKTGAKKVVKKTAKKKNTTKKKATKKTTKKVAEKKITKKSSSKTAKKASPKTDEEALTLKYKELITRIRRAKKPETINKAFEDILALIDPRIQRLVSRFRIPGLSRDDVYQEALYALRYKAIKDYDHKRGVDENPAPFDRFALLCIRRHLATEFKVSFQNKRKVLNSSISLNQDSNGKDQDLSLMNIVPAEEGDVLEDLEEKEFFSSLITKLYNSLSLMEKEVFVLYAQKFSYEEIAQKINEKDPMVRVDIKSVDNALSRIKSKAKYLSDQIDDEDF